MKLARFYYNLKYGLPLRKPRIIPRIAKAYFDYLTGRRIPLRYTDLCLSLNCNLSCEHCFRTNFEKPEGEGTSLTPEEWRGVIKQLIDLGNIAIGFTGGEPLANPNLEHIIERAYPDRLIIIINTNGTLLTKERAKRLYRLGVDVLQISLDSGVEAEHDKFRGMKGAYQKALQGIDWALEAGLKVNIAPTVSHDNLHTEGFKRLVEISREKGTLLNLSLAAPAGKWNGNTDSLLTEKDSAVLNSLVLREPLVRRDFETNYLKQGCGAAKEKLYITNFGDVIPCPYMHITFGNVRDSSISDIRKRMLDLPAFARYVPNCLVAENRSFIDNHMSKTWTGPTPTPWEKAFPEGDKTLDPPKK
jgi:MoaA/NifB/PqqE/SkfB family radical SAM enzyme